MDFYLVIFYALLNVGFFCGYYLKYKDLFNPGVTVFTFYLFVAICAIPAYEALPNDIFFCRFDFSKITAWPYLFYFPATLLLIRPIFKYDEHIDCALSINAKGRISLFIYTYILISIVAIFLYQRTIIDNSVFENFDEIRQDHYAGVQIKAYNNRIEQIILLFVNYFSTVIKIILFYLLTNKKGDVKIPTFVLIILCIEIVLLSVMEASRTASRSMIVTYLIEFIICYTLFRNSISKKTKNYLVSILFIITLIMIGYSMLVTQARFGQNDEDNSFLSLICYWGQPTLVFNSQVSQIDTFAFGARFFYPVFDLLGAQPDIILSQINQGWGTCFTTLVGDLWQDIGPFAIILSFIIGFSYNRWLSGKQQLGIAELYIMLYYAKTIQKGALVTGYGMCTEVLICFVMYCLLKMIFPNQSHTSINTNTNI